MITLWLVAILSAMAVAIASQVSLELRIVRYRIASAQARVLAQGGVRLAVAILEADLKEGEDGDPKTQYDWLGDDWAAPLTLPVESAGAATATDFMTVAITDEERKFKLRDATTLAQVELLKRLGVNEKTAQAIIDYQDPPDHPAEDDANGHPPYRAKNDAIEVLEEVLDIPAVRNDPQAFSVLQKLTTASPIGAVNFNTATLKVLSELVERGKPDTRQMLDVLVEWDTARKGHDGREGTADDCALTSRNPVKGKPELCIEKDKTQLGSAVSVLKLDVVSSIFQVVVDVQRSNPSLTYHLEAVVDRKPPQQPSGQTPGSSPARIIGWREG